MTWTEKGVCLGEGRVFKEKDGSPVAFCARTALIKALDAAKKLGLTFTLGFEIKFVLMKRGEKGEFEPLDNDGHAWRVRRHGPPGERTRGQYEIVLPKAPALEAVDTLLYARNVLSSHATSTGYRMTLHPKPFAMACGTASHVHISVDGDKGNDPAIYEPFYAGILKHLRAICAFTYSSDASYERVADGTWAGGTYVAWGTQNRERPLRKIAGSHWEIKCMDGIANAYLALAVVVTAGARGVREGEAGLRREVPAGMTEDEQAALGIRTRIPRTLGGALEALFRLKSVWGVVGNHEKSGLPDDVVPVASQDIIHEIVKRYCIPHTCM
ncbi:hypothetical protein V2G26_007445 [Clonostachys chloroleuca]